MILDTESHRPLLLQLIRMSSFSGQSLDTVFALKQAIEKASVLSTAPAAAGTTPEATAMAQRLADASN
jgi:hypothetical protein